MGKQESIAPETNYVIDSGGARSAISAAGKEPIVLKLGERVDFYVDARNLSAGIRTEGEEDESSTLEMVSNIDTKRPQRQWPEQISSLTPTYC